MNLRKFKTITVFLAIVLLFSLISAQVSAEEPTDLPIYYFGFVRIDGELAQNGILVSVKVDGTQVASTNIPTHPAPLDSGYYHLYVPPEHAGLVATFEIGNFGSETITLGEIGSAQSLDFIITSDTEGEPIVTTIGGGTSSEQPPVVTEPEEPEEGPTQETEGLEEGPTSGEEEETQEPEEEPSITSMVIYRYLPYIGIILAGLLIIIIVLRSASKSAGSVEQKKTIKGKAN